MLNETKVNDIGQIYNTKVKVITEKTKATRFEPKQKNQLNQDRVESPIIITKKIMIDNDLDPFYDKATEIKYLKHKNNKYGVLVDKKNRLVTYKLNDKTMDIVNMIESKDITYKDINDSNIDEIGYFDDNDNLVIEYYDFVNDNQETTSFEDLKM